VELIEQAMGWERVAAWVESQRLDTLRRFEAARVQADTELGEDVEESSVPRSVSQRAALRRLKGTLEAEAGRFAAEEIALALNISVTRAHQQLNLARDLHMVHPHLHAALQAGQVSGFVVSMVAQATRALPSDARRVIDGAVTCDAVEQPAGRAITAARARVSQADAYAETAAARAVADRRVYLKPLDDGLALLGAVIPAADALRVYTRCDDLARAAARHPGCAETLDQLRTDAFVHTMLDYPDAASPNLSSAADDRDDETPPPHYAPPARPVTVSVVIALTSLLGFDSQPGWLDGYGTVTAGSVQRIIAGGDPTLTRLLCDPVTGATIVADPTRYGPGPALAHAASCRDRHCRLPVCDARIRHLDHLQAYADAGLTTRDNLQGLCVRSHLAKHHPGWTVTGNADAVVCWQTPTGHQYTSIPPPATGPGTGPPGKPRQPAPPPGWPSTQ
jgi:hypothetical protein